MLQNFPKLLVIFQSFLNTLNPSKSLKKKRKKKRIKAFYKINNNKYYEKKNERQNSSICILQIGGLSSI